MKEPVLGLFDKLKKGLFKTKKSLVEDTEKLAKGRKVDDELLDEKRYVLKTKKAPAPMPEPELDLGADGEGGGDFDFGGDDDFNFGGDVDDAGFNGEENEFDAEIEDAEGDEEISDDGFSDDEFEDDEDLNFDEEEDDPIKAIQKTTGELGQQLRDTEDVSSDMTKWVAKSVMSALDVDNLDTSDKKDIIKALKKKPQEDNDGGDDFEDDGGETEFDFGGMEETYDSYMDDEFEVEDIPMQDIDMGIKDKSYLNTDPNVLTSEDLYGPNDSYDSYMDDDEAVEDELYDVEDYPMTDLDMGIQDKGMLNQDPLRNSDKYDSYMEEDDETIEDGMCLSCGGSGCSHCAGLGYHDVDDLEMKDIDMGIQDKSVLNLDAETIGNEYGNYMGEDNPNIGGDEDIDNLLFDDYMEEDEYMTIEDELGLPKATADMDETDYEHTPMMGESNNLGEEDIDNLNEFDEYDDEHLNDDDMKMNDPAPAKPKTKPGTKEPDTAPPSQSKRPFTTPPHITPGEEPRPKAKGKTSYMDDDLDVTFE